MKKIVVSMTSYPGRIKNVGKSIFLLLTKQSIKPDEIHLWLSKEEFPHCEKDLPEDLVLIIKKCNVILHWVEKNTYVHKRHEIFKIVKDAYVFLIDDDVRYNDDLIKNVIDASRKNPGSIVCYTMYDIHEYSGRKIIYKTGLKKFPIGEKLINKVRWNGQSMIPSDIYPKECLSEENQKIRNNTSPISDECWMQPWIVYNDIPITFLKMGWGEDIDPNNGKQKGLVGWTHQKDSNGYEKRDNWLYAVLKSYPKIMEKYKKLFKYDSE